MSGEEREVDVVVLVPFRAWPGQARTRQLACFLTTLQPLLTAEFGAGRWAVLVGEQSWDGHLFRRSALLNALAKLAAAKYAHVKRFIVHDVDVVPDVERGHCYAAPFPAGACALPLHTAGRLRRVYAVQPAALLGIVNGFCNALEGWGCGEDTMLQLQLETACGSEDVHAVCTQALPGAMCDLNELLKVKAAARAHELATCKLPSDERRRRCSELAEVVVAGHGRAPHGAAELVFSVQRGMRRLGDSGAVFAVALDVHVELPEGWVQAVDVVSCLPVYMKDGQVCATLPVGSIVAVAEAPVGAEPPLCV